MKHAILLEDGHKHMIPQRYVPSHITKMDERKQMKSLKRSRNLYKHGKYYIRPHIQSFKSRRSHHLRNAEELYRTDRIRPSKALSQKTGCSINALEQIVNKGRGAYYSSGSRPNQTPESWGISRLASAITGQNASIVDFHILEKGCKPNSLALRLARKTKKKHA
jgi:Family of unknown function (DUF5824)